MRRRSNLLLIAVFLTAQLLSILHSADFGFQIHEHGGQVCEIFLHCDKGTFVVVPAPFHVSLPVAGNALIQASTALLSDRKPSTGIQARAPPATL